MQIKQFLQLIMEFIYKLYKVIINWLIGFIEKYIQMEKDNKKNDQQKTLVVSSFHQQILIYHLNNKQTQQENALIFSRITQLFTQKTINLTQTKQKCQKIDTYYFFLGSISLEQITYLVFVSQSKLICQFQGHKIYQIQKIQWMATQANNLDNKIQSSNQLRSDVNSLFQLGGYYYSDTLDLTQSKEYAVDHNNHRKVFTWNLYLIQSLIFQNISERWRMPIIQGNIDYFEHTFINNKTLQYLLISRRSSRRAGTRFFSRGVDDQGNVANFVQTEQLILYDDCLISHVQIRGSVPVFWEQVGVNGITGKLKIGRTNEFTDHAFLAHFYNLKLQYKRFLCINLLTQKKQNQNNLLKTFQTMIKRNESLGQVLRYQYFDFHEICKGENFHKCNPFIFQVKNIVSKFGFYLQDINQNKVIKRQQGVVRTNCLDCLDRTNYIQTKLSIQILEQILSKIGISFKESFIENIDRKESFELIRKLKKIWADNGDKLSVQYTGMNSTHSDIIRQGQRGIFGIVTHKWVSLNRFFKQFTDERKHNAINLMLGYDKNQIGVKKQIVCQLNKLRSEYSRIFESLFSVISWNLNQKQFKGSLQKLLYINNQLGQPRFIILALQNINETSKTDLLQKIQEIFNKKQYMNVSTKASKRCLLSIYFKQSNQIKINRISEISHSKIKLKYNQGIVFTRFKFFQTEFLFGSFCFDSPHALFSYSQEFHEEAFQQPILGRQKQSKVKIIEFKILAGYIGKSLDIKIEKIEELLSNYKKLKEEKSQINRSKIINQLFKYDIFDKQRIYNSYLRDYSEQAITFEPIFNIDSSIEKQLPTWSNRILVQGQQNSIIKQLNYSPIQITQTNYKPVNAIYKFEIRQQNQDKKINKKGYLMSRPSMKNN